MECLHEGLGGIDREIEAGQLQDGGIVQVVYRNLSEADRAGEAYCRLPVSAGSEKLKVMWASICPEGIRKAGLKGAYVR